MDVRKVGRDLGVRYVLEGSVRRSDNHVRINAQLLDAETGAHLWAERFDVERSKLAEAQSEITARIARTLMWNSLRPKAAESNARRAQILTYWTLRCVVGPPSIAPSPRKTERRHGIISTRHSPLTHALSMQCARNLSREPPAEPLPELMRMWEDNSNGDSRKGSKQWSHSRGSAVDCQPLLQCLRDRAHAAAWAATAERRPSEAAVGSELPPGELVSRSPDKGYEPSTAL